MESISSIKIIEGFVFLADSKTFFSIFSDYPTNLLTIEPADNW